MIRIAIAHYQFETIHPFLDGNVRHKNDLVQWMKFFLVGVLETADKSSTTPRKILELKSDLEKNKIMKMGKRATKGSLLLQSLFSTPVVNGK